jgi:hypothetical protein
MSYPHARHQIHELVQAPKVVRENSRLEVEASGEHGGRFDVDLDLVDGPFVDLRYLGKATDQREPTGYEGNLILAGHRARGVGHNFVGRNNLRAKQRQGDPAPSSHRRSVATVTRSFRVEPSG